MAEVKADGSHFAFYARLKGQKNDAGEDSWVRLFVEELSDEQYDDFNIQIHKGRPSEGGVRTLLANGKIVGPSKPDEG